MRGLLTHKIAGFIEANALTKLPPPGKERVFIGSRLRHFPEKAVEPDILFLITQVGSLDVASERSANAGMIEIARFLDGAADAHSMGDLASNRAALQLGLAADDLHDVVNKFDGLGHRLLPIYKVAFCYLHFKGVFRRKAVRCPNQQVSISLCRSKIPDRMAALTETAVPTL